MPNRTLLIASWLLAAGAGVANASAEKLTAAYTPAEGNACKTIFHDNETGDTTRRCPGMAGYALLVLESDDRASISLVTPNGNTLPLNFWEVVSPTFSTLGSKVEWRLVSKNGKQVPVAIIARVNTVDQADVRAPQPLAFLVVAHIRRESACVTAKIPASQVNARARIRALANDTKRQCLVPSP